MGGISFNIKGAAVAAAKEQVQIQEELTAARARRLNTKDAATQTVRDPEKQDGGIVTVWRLRPRGVGESFPKATKRKAREPTICAGAEPDPEPPAWPGAPALPTGKRRQIEVAEAVSERPEGLEVASAAGTAPLQVQSVAASAAAAEDSDESLEEGALQAALARTVNS